MRILRTISAAARTKGILRWGEVREAANELRERSYLTMAASAAKEVAGGVVLAPALNAVFEIRPDHLTLVENGEDLTVRPGLVFGGCGWLEPTIGGASIFNTPAPLISGHPQVVVLEVTARPHVALDRIRSGGFDYVSYFAPHGMELLSARILTAASMPADIKAQGTHSTSGFNEYLTLTRDATYHLALGTRRVDGTYAGRGDSGHVTCRMVSSGGSGATLDYAVVFGGDLLGTNFIF